MFYVHNIFILNIDLLSIEYKVKSYTVQAIDIFVNDIIFLTNYLLLIPMLEGQTQHTLRFSSMPITMVQVSKLYDDPFWRKHILG